MTQKKAAGGYHLFLLVAYKSEFTSLGLFRERVLIAYTKEFTNVSSLESIYMCITY